jgi:hypothetical protein
MKTFYFSFAAIAMAATVPALLAGLHLAATFNLFPLFAVPALVCVALSGYALHKFETM